MAKTHTEKWDEFFNIIQGDPLGAPFRAAATRISITLALETTRREGAELEETFPIKEAAGRLGYDLSPTMSGPKQGLTVAKEETMAIQRAMDKEKPKEFTDAKPDPQETEACMDWAAAWAKRLGEIKTWEQGKAAQLSWAAAWTQAGKDLELQIKKTKAGTAVPENPILNMWVKCEAPGCTWTIAGDGGGKPKLDATEVGHDTQYLITKNVQMGILEDNGNDHRNDGRGDEGREARYRQAYKDHQDRNHSKTGLKDMILIDPAKFKTKMSDLDFEEEKEAWTRYLQRNPTSEDNMRMEMMKRSMSPELLNIMKTYILDRDNKLGDKEDMEKWWKEMEDLAVVAVPNSEHIAHLKTIIQNPGEKVAAFLSRVRGAAAYIECTNYGACTEKTHPGAPVRQGGKRWPCEDGEKWATILKNTLKGSDDAIDNNHPDCKECCHSVRDDYAKEALIKEQFMEGLHDETFSQNLRMHLTNWWQRLPWSPKEPIFEAKKCTMNIILKTAKNLELNHGKKVVEVAAAVTTIKKPKYTAEEKAAYKKAQEAKRGKTTDPKKKSKISNLILR